MIFEIRDGGRVVMPDRLERILQVWWRVSLPPLGVGAVLVCVGGVLENNWMVLSGLPLCLPFFALGWAAEAVLVLALLATAATASFRAARYLMTLKRRAWKKGVAPKLKGLWDYEMDG